MPMINPTMHSVNTTPNRNVSGNLTQDDFLKILVAQMKYQDPLSPTNDTEFMSQMAQFSALEQMVNLNSNFSNMFKILGMGFDSVNAFSLIGKEVEINLGKDESFKGIVDKVLQKNGEFLVEVNSVQYTLDKVISVSNPSKIVQESSDNNDLDNEIDTSEGKVGEVND